MMKPIAMVKRICTNGRLAATLLVAAAGLTLGLAGPAMADAQRSASCVGFEASSISPPGSSAEFTGGMPALRQWIGQTFPGVPPGAVLSTVAKLHEGSHEACDEALE
jgi:hypothetical protein